MYQNEKLISTAIMKTDITGFSNIVGELTDFELSKFTNINYFVHAKKNK